MTPYRDWTRNEIFWKLKKQVVDYHANNDYMDYTIKNACFDERWNPMEEYNGCTLVQDDIHPFLPCFIHDWRWVTRQDVPASNIEFKENLLAFGYSKFKAQLYYIAVTLGYYLYFKYKHKK